MKEYLVKTDGGSYLYTKNVSDIAAEWVIEIPDGAVFATICGEFIAFWKDGAVFFAGSDKEWDFHYGLDILRYMKVTEYNGSKVVWQRHTQPEELPFLDSINDQYAEIEQVRKQTIEATLAERQAQYGCFEDVARTTGKIMEALSEVRVNGLNDLPYPHRMALYMIASKMARIVNGDFNSIDEWHDISGYATLVERLIDG